MYALRYREELAPAVVKEMDDFISFLQHYLAVSLNEDGSLRLATPSGAGASKNTVTITDAIEAEEGHWWKKGPWIFDTDHSHEAFLVTPTLAAATINDYAPAGIDTAIGVEFNLGGNITITGIKAPPRAYRRIMVLRNNSATYTVTLKHNSASSQPLNRFQLPGSVDIVMGTRQTAWLYYDADNHNWGSFITGNTSGGLSGAGGGASGDVTGPGSATSGNFASFNGTTGKIIQDSGFSSGSFATVGGSVVRVTTTLTEAQFEASNTTPVTLVAAQGANTVIVPIYWAPEVNLTTNYPNNPVFSIAYAVDPTQGILATYTMGINAGAPSTKLIVGASNNPAFLTFAYGTTDPRNSALVFRANGNPDASGAATAKIHLAYMIINTF